MSSTRALPGRLPHCAAALAGAAAFALALSGCSGSTTSTAASSGTGNTKFVSGTGQVTTVVKGKRQNAPALSGKDLEGKQLSLADYKGKVVVLNIWGSWCAPCRAEAPNLVAVAKADAGKGVQFIGINTRDMETSQAVSFEKEFGVPYPSLYDPYGKLILRFPKGSLNPQTIPTTIIVDRQGKIAVRALTALTEDQLNKALDPVIAEK
jgi:thiol-disulfide isomerase/thioredoxin